MAAELFMDGRLFIFSGHYGSGKSEIAVNFALELARFHKTAIVDFDIVNPYFRTAGARRELERQGIRVVTPIYANTNVDVPALPAEISSLFDDKSVKAIFDAGGDSAGAKAISRYHEEFISERTDNFFVFNLRRPSTSTLDDITDIFYEIQESARLPFTALVNNTNLLSWTGESDLLEGLSAAVELSKRLSLPVAFSACMSGVYENGAAAMPYAGAGEFIKRSGELGIPVFNISKHILMEY